MHLHQISTECPKQSLPLHYYSSQDKCSYGVPILHQCTIYFLIKNLYHESMFFGDNNQIRKKQYCILDQKDIWNNLMRKEY